MHYGGQCGGNFKYFWRYSTNVKRRIYLGVRTCEFFFVFFTIILQGSTIWFPFSHNATPERIELSLHLASWTEVGPKRTFNNSRTCITLRGQPRGMAGWPFDRSRPLNAGSTDKGFHKKRYTTNTVYFDFGRETWIENYFNDYQFYWSDPLLVTIQYRWKTIKTGHCVSKGWQWQNSNDRQWRKLQ